VSIIVVLTVLNIVIKILRNSIPGEEASPIV